MTISEHRKYHTKGEKNPMYGKNHTLKTKSIISKKNKGKGLGKKHTKECKKKMSELRKKYWKTHLKMLGEKNPSFGIRKSNEEKIIISKKTKEGMAKSKKWKEYIKYIENWKVKNA